MADPSFTLTAREFRDLVKPVIPLAHPDQMLPALNTVMIESEGSHLIASATDRFVVGITRVEPGQKPPKGIGISVPLASVRAILAMFKATRKVDPELEFTVEDKGTRLRVRQGGGAIDFLDASVSYRLEVDPRPKLYELMAQRIQAAEEPHADLALNASYLAKFAGAVRHGEPLEIKVGANDKAVLVTVGEHFIGAIMPTRAGDPAVSADVRHEWLDLFSKPTAKKKAA